MTVLVLGSQNEKKLRELQSILSGFPAEIVSLKQFPGAPDVVEDGATFEENAVKKARAYARFTGRLALADDSGLCVDALEGAPGVRSARYAGEKATDADNCQKLMEAMRSVPDGKRGAAFHCTIAIAEPSGEIIGVARGEFRGEIARERRGTNGFGYDPLFIEPASGKRFAELSAEEKHAISHRGRALAEAREILKNYLSSGSSR